MAAPDRRLNPLDHASPHPIYVVWELTLRCDQACRHCGSRAGVTRRDEVDTPKAMDIVQQLAAAGTREVTLIGGESYLRDDWSQIAAAVVGAGMQCSLVTGGRGFHDGRVRAARAAGVSTVCVSIDGLEPAHDTLRAVPGSWRAAIDAIRNTASAGMTATVNTQIHQRNRHTLLALGEALIDAGAKAWQLQLTTPMGRAADQDRLILQPFDLLELLPELARIADILRPKGLQLNIANNLGYFGPHEASLRAGSHWIGCTGGRWSLGIQADGVIKACGSLPTAAYGDMSLMTHSLAEILAQSEAVKSVTERTTDQLWGHCAECYYAELCQGGCVWTAHTLLGRPGNQPYCHHRAMELAARGLRERLTRREHAPGGGFDHGLWDLTEEPIP